MPNPIKYIMRRWHLYCSLISKYWRVIYK